MRFGTILVDPPWPYAKSKRWVSEDKKRKQTGYSNFEYNPLSEEALASLPVGEVASDQAVLMLWTTFPMLPAAVRLVEKWGFQYVTGLPWVKITEWGQTYGDELAFKPNYGVGYWVRGAAEICLVAKKPGARSHRSQWMGLLCKSAVHSKKPTEIYDLAESYPGPRLEIFARHRREGWRQLGDELPGDGRDIRASLAELAAEGETDDEAA